MSSGDANPYFDPGPFGQILIADVVVAATLTEVDGATSPEDWSVQKGTGTSGATASWKGTKLAEALKLKFRAHDGDAFQAMTDLLLLVRPKKGQKPPTVNIENAIVNWGGIGKGAIKTPPEPKWDAKDGAWDFTWEFQEIGPSTGANTGAAGAPAPDPKDPPTAQSAADKEIAKLSAQVAAL